jgi:hypothetical protein
MALPSLRPDKRWGYFPAGSVAWRLTKEKFLSNVTFLNEAKLRFGYGTMGNNRIRRLFIPEYIRQ